MQALTSADSSVSIISTRYASVPGAAVIVFGADAVPRQYTARIRLDVLLAVDLAPDSIVEETIRVQG